MAIHCMATVTRAMMIIEIISLKLLSTCIDFIDHTRQFPLRPSVRAIMAYASPYTPAPRVPAAPARRPAGPAARPVAA